jgi:8-oxo-dGTP pyrophosphatase MutT (NUDIX family)
LDDHKDIEYKVKEELWEELGITSDKVISIKIAQPIYRDEKEYDKTWIVFPILVEISTQELKTDFEHSGFKWFKINEISDMLNEYKIIPDIKDILEIFFNK